MKIGMSFPDSSQEVVMRSGEVVRIVRISNGDSVFENNGMYSRAVVFGVP